MVCMVLISNGVESNLVMYRNWVVEVVAILVSRKCRAIVNSQIDIGRHLRKRSVYERHLHAIKIVL